ncbi:MAG: heavy metal translocating P-type ATPase, partial [Bacteroidales bacterium]
MLSEKNNIYLRPFISSLLLLTGFIFHFFHFAFYQHDISPLLWNILAYLPVGIPVLIEAYKCIKNKDIFSEYTLMSIATIGAFCIGEYPEAVSVMLFYTIGEIFQDRAVNRAKQNITSLLNLKSNITFVIRNGQAIATDPKLVQIGDIIEVKVGERVSLDGSLLSPSSACFDTAALTGESTPKTIGEKGSILSGMLSLNKVVHIKVTKPY